MADAGIGGVEVAYVYPLAPDSESSGQPSSWPTSATPQTRRMRSDCASTSPWASGWSFGGPHITAEHAARKLHWERREISPGAAADPDRRALAGRRAGRGLSRGRIAAGTPERAQPVAGRRRIDRDPGRRRHPPGAARLRQHTGQNVKRAAFGAEGPVLDHYSAAAARDHLRHVGDPLLEAVPAHLLGSVFCDSLEVYGSDWTPGLMAEFAGPPRLRPAPRSVPAGRRRPGRDATARGLPPDAGGAVRGPLRRGLQRPVGRTGTAFRSGSRATAPHRP